MATIINGAIAMRNARLRAGFPTLAAVVAESYKRFGERGKLNQAQISRIENGKLPSAPMELLCTLGALYNVSPNQLAEWFGYPWAGGTAPSDDERLVYVRTVADSLPPSERERLYDELLLDAQRAEFRLHQQRVRA